MRALLIMVLVAGCSKGGVVDTVRERLEGDPPPVPVRADDSCHSQMFRKYVGQSADVLYGLVIVQPSRLISPGDAVTEDFDQTRINFDLDDAGTITRVWCG